MQGLHLTADLYQCRCGLAWLADADQLGAWCLQAVRDAGLRPVSQLFDTRADSQGAVCSVSVTVVLAGSHVCLHAWPRRLTASADVYVCGDAGDSTAPARVLMAALVDRFQPEWTEQRSMDRGDGQ